MYTYRYSLNFYDNKREIYGTSILFNILIPNYQSYYGNF